MGNINASDPDYWNVAEDPGTRHTNWMSKLPDSKYLNDVSMPGTHNSMAKHGTIWACCQSLSLGTQLQIGIRFFDIRCRHFGNCLPIHHGVSFQNCSFTDCMNTMSSFVKSNPSEFLVVRVKEEYTPDKCDRSFCKSVWVTLFKNWRDNVWLAERVPTVKEARGKIVILHDFDKEGQDVGILYEELDTEDTHTQNSDEDKFDKVQNHLRKAIAYKDNKIYLTFNSCCILIDCPAQSARRLNTKLHNFVQSNNGRLGIIAMDYPGPILIKDIIEKNFL